MVGPAVVVEAVDGLPGPTQVVRAVAHLAGDRRLTAVSGSWSGTGFLLAVDPVEVVERTADELTADDLVGLLDRAGLPPRDPAPGPDGSPGSRGSRGSRGSEASPAGLGTVPGAGAVGGGWSVVLGHALGRLTGRVRTAPPPSVGPRLPDLVLARHTHLLRHDGTRWWAEAADEGDGVATARARALVDEVLAACERATRSPAPPPPAGAVRLRHVPDAAAHMAAVERVVTAVRAGDIAQANVCGRFALGLRDGGPAAVAAWADLVDRLSPDRATLVTGPWGALVGASPETYLSVAGGRVSSSPIKGTRPAGQGRALADSAKDTSENVMIVDLVRNDLARVCEPGSVAVDELLAVRPLAGVAHLVSRVSGRLRPDVGPGALVVGTFPPGSVTGTPKQRAGEVTDGVEAEARGAHTGAVGFLGPGLADLAVTIRTLEVGPDGSAALGVGGGIVADSTPAEEWHEVLTKAAPLLGALGMTAVTPSPSTAACKGLADPSAGLIETVLAVDARAVAVADHVARLRRSAWELTGRSLTTDVERLLDDAAARAGAGAHRLRVRCGLPSLRVQVEVEPWHRPVPPGQQRGLVLGVRDAPPPGLERHKYADRRFLDEALAGPSDGVAGAVGADGIDDVAFRAPDGLLETTRSCLLAVVTGPDGPGLVTPPCDGRLLPGTTRQVLVDLALQQGWTVTLAGLDDAVMERAEGLVAANALRGARWVAAVGPHRWSGPSAATAGLAEALLRRWRLLPA